MTPATIKVRETKFATSLTDSSGKKFTAGNTIDIGDGFTITPISPGYKTYFYQTRTKKTQICLHFTVGVISGDVASLTKENNHMSVPYVVDRMGNIYRLFDDAFWSYHLGANAIGGNQVMSKQSIGIEISNYGPLKERDGKFVDAYGNMYSTEYEDVESVSYRGYDYYARMTTQQKKAIAHLLRYLSDKHGIPLKFKDDIGEVFETNEDAVNFSGVFCHSNVRTDKFDLPPELSMQIKCTLDGTDSRVEKEDKVEPTPEPNSDPNDEPAVKNPQPETDISQREFVVKEDANGELFVAEVDHTEPVEEQVPKGFIDKLVDWLRKLIHR